MSEVGDGVKIHVVRLDVSKAEEVEHVFDKLPREFADVDVLVNNAGFMSGYERAPEIPDEVVEEVWKTNVLGVIGMTQGFLRVAKGRGDVVMIGSIAGREAYAGGSVCVGFCDSGWWEGEVGG